MNEQQAIEFFVAQSIGMARSLPIDKARAYLKGLLLLGGERDALSALHDAYTDLCAIDEQFKALQLQLTLR
jgi:hypothetical protein